MVQSSYLATVRLFTASRLDTLRFQMLRQSAQGEQYALRNNLRQGGHRGQRWV